MANQEHNPETATDSDVASSAATSGDASAKQGKVRSGTSYPYYGLKKAIEILAAVRRAGGNAPAPKADVLREMGIAKETDRGWAYGIPAATQFGLIERVGRGDEGQIKLTELGIRIALPQSDDELRTAKIAAFKSPELYLKLYEQFAGHPVPSREGLRNMLLRQYGIVESMTANAADAFLESLQEAGLLADDKVASNGATATPPVASAEKQKAPVVEAEPPPGKQALYVDSDYVIYKCKISGKRIIELPLPRDFAQKDVTRLTAFLKTQIDEDPEGDNEED